MLVDDTVISFIIYKQISKIGSSIKLMAYVKTIVLGAGRIYHSISLKITVLICKNLEKFVVTK